MKEDDDDMTMMMMMMSREEIHKCVVYRYDLGSNDGIVGC